MIKQICFLIEMIAICFAISLIVSGIENNNHIIICLGMLIMSFSGVFLLITLKGEPLEVNNKKEIMEIHTEDKEMKNHLEKAFPYIDKGSERNWSEYELRLLIQDETSCLGNGKVGK